MAESAVLPPPLTPSDCDLRDFPYLPLDVKRLLASETWILGSGDERAAALALWLESWHQVPAASLPENDRMLGHLSQAKNWKRVKEHALRGWVRCHDGRLYHVVVAEKALEGWIEKLINSHAGARGNAQRWEIEVDIGAITSRIVEAARLLMAIAPQSKTLRKKAVMTILAASGGEGQTVAPRHPSASPPDTERIARESEGKESKEKRNENQGDTRARTACVDAPAAAGETHAAKPRNGGQAAFETAATAAIARRSGADADPGAADWSPAGQRQAH